LRTDYYENYPELSTQTLTMKALNKTHSDKLEGGRSVIRIRGNVDSGAKSGVPIVSDIIDTYVNVPVKKDISDIDQRYAVVLQSPKLKRDLKVQGASRVNLTLMPHATPVTLIAYLYDENIWGTGSLVSFSVMSFQDPSLVPEEVSFDLNVTSFQVEKGHRLTLAIDTVDSLYAPATTKPYNVSLAVDPSVVLELPIVE
jgi:predicted acyl esterase